VRLGGAQTDEQLVRDLGVRASGGHPRQYLLLARGQRLARLGKALLRWQHPDRGLLFPDAVESWPSSPVSWRL
jgi:hypothetical protein